MAPLTAVQHCESEIDAELRRYQERQKAIEARQGTGVRGFDDSEAHARLGTFIARLADWQAQVRAARIAVLHGAAFPRETETHAS
jgi:hypothetical protein